MTDVENHRELTALEAELLAALEKANWFIHDMGADGHQSFREKELLPLIEKAGRIQAEADLQKWKTLK